MAVTYCGVEWKRQNGPKPSERQRATAPELATPGEYTDDDRAATSMVIYANEVLTRRWIGAPIAGIEDLVQRYNAWRSGLKKNRKELHESRVQATRSSREHFEKLQEAEREKQRMLQEAEFKRLQEAEMEQRGNAALSFKWEDYAHFHGEVPSYC
jgi:hypothetical protein